MARSKKIIETPISQLSDSEVLEICTDALKVIKPLVRVADEPHILEKMFEKDPPEMKSVGYMPVKDGAMSWISYTMITKGDKVLSIEVGEPNLRAIAEESAKIAFVETFVDHEAF